MQSGHSGASSPERFNTDMVMVVQGEWSVNV